MSELILVITLLLSVHGLLVPASACECLREPAELAIKDGFANNHTMVQSSRCE